MQVAQREAIYLNYLQTLLNEGSEEENFVVFTDIVTEKFIQYIALPTGSFLLDIPKQAITKQEADRLERNLAHLFEELEFSYQADLTLNESIEVAEIIFLEIYQSDPDYTFNTEIYLG